MHNLLAFSASAGSGKTYTITRKYLKLLLCGHTNRAYRNILAVTFTNKATAEMKERILKDLNRVAKGSYEGAAELAAGFGLTEAELQARAAKVQADILHDYSRFSVLTIDTFFQRILRSFVREAKLTPEYSVELDQDRLLAEGVDAMLENLHESDELRQWLKDFIFAKIDEGKTWNVKNDLTELGKEIFKEQFMDLYASMGEQLRDKKFLDSYLQSLRKITNDIDEQMQEIGKKAQEYLKNNGLSVDYFSYGPGGFYGYFIRIENFAKIEDDDKDYNKNNSRRTSEALGKIENWFTKKNFADAKKKPANEAAYAYLNPLLEEACTLWDENKVAYRSANIILQKLMQLGLLADIMQHVRAIEKESGTLTFGETTKHISNLIGDSDAPFIYEKIGNRYEHFMLDEFQDTSALQWQNFKPLLRESLGKNEHALCMVVGDVKQSIYRWRNGDWSILRRLQDGEEQGFEKVFKRTLGTNYRSLPQVVQFNNELFRQLEKSGAATKSIIAPAYTRGEQKVSPKKAKAGGGYVRLEFLPEAKKGEAEKAKEGEAEQSPNLTLEKLKNQIAALCSKGYQLRDMAVIVRYNEEATLVANALLEASYNVVSQDALMVDSAAVVRQMVAMLRLASGQQSTIDEHLLASELGISDMENCKHFLATLPRRSLSEAVEAIIGQYKLNKNQDHIPYLQAFQDLALNFASRKISDIGAFLEWWEQQGNQKSKLACPEGQNAITISTIHKVKGLQYKVVLLPFASWNIDSKAGSTVWMKTGQSKPFCDLPCVPLSYYSKQLAKTIFAEQYEDEKQHALVDCLNMLYVALTRAEEQLFVFAEQAMPSAEGNMASINVALWQLFSTLQADGTALKFGELDGRKTEQDGGSDGHSVVFEFGEMHAPIPSEDKPAEQAMLTIDEYPSQRCSTLRCNSVESWNSERSTPILSGSKMHKIFERIATAADVEIAVKRCIDDGLATDDEREWLCSEVHRLIAHPQAAQWFDGSWTLLCETDIVLRKDDLQTIVRPDRVMFKGKQAVVLDYKFGLSRHHNSNHRAQVETYVSALREMGYDTQGVVWYVTQGEVVKV